MTTPHSSPLASEPVSPVDLAWLRMDDPTNLMMITGVLTFEQPLEIERLKEVIEKRLLPISRFRRRISGSPLVGRPRWEDDPNFNLDDHVIHEVLPGAGGDEELQERVCALMSQPLDPTRPLWCFHLFDNYKGGSALLGRLHHAIGDGIALVLVVLSLVDRSPAYPLPVITDDDLDHFNPFVALFRHGKRAIHSVRAAAEELMPEGMKLLLKPAEAYGALNPLTKGVASSGALARLAARPADPQTLFRGPLGVAKKAVWSQAIPFDDVRSVVSSLGATVNDVLMTAVAGGLRRYLVGRGARTAGLNFRAAVPVNLRPLEKMADLGNLFGLVFLSLPIGIEDPEARLVELKRRMGSLKRSMEPPMTLRVLDAMGRMPYAMQRGLVSMLATKATAVLTNVPGPREPLHLAGRRMSGMFFWVPQAGRVSLGISILSYAGSVRLGVASDAGLVPDPARIIEGFYAELDALMALASRS